MILQTKKSKVFISLLGLIAICFILLLILFNNLQFLIYPVQEIQGSVTNYRRSKTVTTVEYLYNVNSTSFIGSSENYFIGSTQEIPEKMQIYYLLSDPSVSIIKVFIVRNIIFSSVILIPLLLGIVFLCIGLLNLLPKEMQDRFSKFLLS